MGSMTVGAHADSKGAALCHASRGTAPGFAGARVSLHSLLGPLSHVVSVGRSTLQLRLHGQQGQAEG